MKGLGLTTMCNTATSIHLRHQICLVRHLHTSLPVARQKAKRPSMSMAMIRAQTSRDSVRERRAARRNGTYDGYVDLSSSSKQSANPKSFGSQQKSFYANSNDDQRGNPLSQSNVSSKEIQYMLYEALPDWVKDPQICRRVVDLGVQEHEATRILALYGSYMNVELAKPPRENAEDADPWGVRHLSQSTTFDERLVIDRALTLRLMSFITDTMDAKSISADSLSSVKQTIAALDLRYPSEAFPNARRMKRKFFLHVGPTNSGKTYNALRALASARNGAYAGPLRLLAHEVWARLNQGSIRPFDADPSTAKDYARQCNLITGEEVRVVSPDAPLASCTVEMLNLFRHHHVVVIDEIQMIADPSRGGAWTAAVLGVCADEIHLCGEEAAVPLIEALIRETNDELVINRYTRLTPLAVASQSLRNNWKMIKKGDCVVTFSRKQIFHLKSVVEKETGLRCAVVYGRLPPETRSEQAALFNHAESGYDVLIASDAIGMGLNLKINRIIFVDLKKSNGISLQHLSLSQIKQIGGRAGRFGAGAGDFGIVTCMRQQNIPTLEEAFDMKAPDLTQATIPMHSAIFSGLAEVLPTHFGVLDLVQLLNVAGRLAAHYNLPDKDASFVGMSIIDSIGKDLCLTEKLQFLDCPVSWRNDAEVGVVSKYISLFASGKAVDLRACLEDTFFLEILYKIDADRVEQSANSDMQTSEMLSVLETLHKVLLSYIWFAYRMPASFHQYDEAAKLKETTERCIEFVLEGIEDIDKQRARILKKASQLRAESADKIEYDVVRKVQHKLQRLATADKI